MKKTFKLALPLAVALSAAPSIAEIRFVPVPNVGTGTVKILVEYARTGTSPKKVDVTRIPEGVSGLGVPATHEQVFTGPSTSTRFPLLNITPSAPGMVIVNSESGLAANEVSMEVGKAPSNTAWELPLLTPETAFQANTTAYVQNLTKTADGAANLSLFNIGGTAGTCRFKIMRPDNTVLLEQTGIAVPAQGAIRFETVLATAAVGAGYVGAVTCDRAFYAMGAFPSTDRTKVRAYYPIGTVPTAGNATTLVDRTGLVLAVREGNSFLRVPIPLETAPSGNGPRYRSLTIDFDVRTADPQGFTVIRNIAGLLRTGGRRFNKTLFFGNFDRLDATGGPKMILDIGTPYIETTIKRLLNLSGGAKNLHFHIELNSDQRTMTYQIFNANGLALFNVVCGLFNDDLNASGANVPNLEFGLPGVADQAYFPPFGWRFSNLKVIGRR